MASRGPMALLLVARRGLHHHTPLKTVLRATPARRARCPPVTRASYGLWGGVAALVGGGVASLAGGVAADLPSVAMVVAEADTLYDQMKYDEIYTLLSSFKGLKSDEVLWRLGRATYERAKAAATEEERRRLFREALDHVEAALAINAENFAVHKWMSILIDYVYAAEGTKARISKSYVVKEHMIKACQLNPGDATSRYLLGYWFFSFANVPWYQRKIASVVFTTPPSGTFEEALENFLLAEKLEPNFYRRNLLMIGKSYLNLGKKAEAKDYLQRTVSYPGKTKDDQEAAEEAESLLKGL
ncbi:Regulator of microtubule dynamics protein 1 [Chionoecetes opilio]|uniref:Regulator of microtubule dynamics protein 1 n=1 Tax=Chionoecetes opilio TaxID=41210 RepID=A0A8J4Y7E1_CHIOP|nr:Regulator of microtubule dynamics protein 1 [Chionoecetes opilio]